MLPVKIISVVINTTTYQQIPVPVYPCTFRAQTVKKDVNLLPEHAVVRVEDLLDEEEEELFGDAARVLRLLANKLHPQRFLQVTRPNHRQLQI
jgi:hypothetical protein